MTPKQRFLAALTGGKTDHVCAAPDTSNMIPCKLTGKPFWDIYLHRDPPLHIAYLEVLKKYGFDGGWETSPNLGPSKANLTTFSREILEKSDEKIVARETVRTPGGDLWQETIYWRDNPPAHSRKYVKSIDDFKIFIKYCFPDPSSCDDTEFQAWKGQIGDRGVAVVPTYFPGLQNLVNVFDCKTEDLIYLYYDHPELFDEYREVCHEHSIKMTQRILQVKPDILQIGSAGTLVFQTPAIFRKLGLPTLKEMTRLAKEAGIPSLMHSCGRSNALVKICAQETDLTGINPLEISPAGDCDLQQLSKEFGNKICLMGNLHTTDVMLNGSPEQVEAAAKKAIDDARGARFILSTGDQCPRDTPEENIFRLIEVAKTYGASSVGATLAVAPH